MRAAVFALLVASAPAALAQTTLPERPSTPAPTAAASFEARETWCEQYANWYIASTPAPAEAASAAPPAADVRATHEFEVEFNSCKIDPREYERQTHAEAELNAEAERG